MNISNKRRLLIGVIIVLLVINITALATFIYNNNVKQKKDNEIRQMQEQIEVSGMHRYLREELNLTEEQFVLFKELSKEGFDKSKSIAYQLDEKRIEFFDELTKENADEKKLDEIAREIGDLHYNLKKETINHYFELKEICTAEQQKVLGKLFMQMIQKDDHRHMERRGYKNRNREKRNHEMIN